MNKQDKLRQLPSVDHLLSEASRDPRFDAMPRKLILESLRTALSKVRTRILSGEDMDCDGSAILDLAAPMAEKADQNHLVPVINVTGVVLHTNLGRALLCRDALENIRTISGAYSNLEFNLDAGRRGIRYAAVEELICELTGAQSAIAVNNNAGAVFLALNTMAQGRQVVVSRGELVEIGGSFRVPDVMAKSGGILKEVGTTNRTHPRDYENAVNEETGLFLKVHTSNYRIEGFTKSVSLKEMVELGEKHGIPVMEDLGSGTFVDFSRYGLPAEPVVASRVAAGADVVTFSGDKLLGGPQAGIIVGKKETIDRIKQNPMTRALRIDKMTLAALEATLKLYRDEARAIREIPTLRMLTLSYESLGQTASELMALLSPRLSDRAEFLEADMESRPGGGSYPGLTLPTRCITIRPRNMSVAALEKGLRAGRPPVIGRIEDDRFIMDVRTLQPGQEETLLKTLDAVLL